MLKLKIKSVKSLGKQEVYDISMPSNQNFVLANGAVAHNCPHSYHYGRITDVTTFLKGIYPEFFFRVTMGLADPNSASRFLAEIQRQTRTPCVMRSAELFWRVIDGEYFPGLSSVDGLNTKAVRRILDAREASLAEVGDLGIAGVTATIFFKHLGALTKSGATVLGRCGILRIFGTPAEIAEGYREALVNHIKPSLARKKAEARAAKMEEDSSATVAGGEDVFSGVHEASTLGEAVHEKEPAKKPGDGGNDGTIDFDSLVFDTVNQGTSPDKSNENDDESNGESNGDTSDSTGGSAVSVESSAGRGRRVSARKEKSASAKEVKVGKPGKVDLAVIDILASKGVAFVEPVDTEDASSRRVMTVGSALDMVLSNKTRGAGIRHLVAALAEEEKRKFDAGGDVDGLQYVMIRDLKSLTMDDGAELEADAVYRTVGIPKVISKGGERKDGSSDPRITLIAEGAEINAKFGRRYDEELKNEHLTMLADGKMSTPFIVDLYVGKFKPPDRDEMITYFKIENLQKLGSSD
jgi:hypothetical protein